MSNQSSTPANLSPARSGGFLILMAVLLLALGALFHRSFEANQILYSNDGPYGLISAKSVATTPSAFSGVWYDLNWLGNEGVTPAPTFSALMAMVLKPLGWAKFSVPVALLFVGVSAWLFFRQLRLAPLACVLAGIAAALNSDFFSTACWGVVGDASCAAASYLALAAITGASNRLVRWPWFRVILTGIAVGLAVMEGYDVGALFSLFVAAYVFYQAFFLGEKTEATGKKFAMGVGQVAVVAMIAGLTAVHVLNSLVDTQIAGVAGQEQTPEAKQRRWDFSTQFSLPKAEILEVMIPGVFGYRQVWHMYEDEEPKDDQYWGTLGVQPNIPEVKAMLSSPDPNMRGQAENYLKNPRVMWRLRGTGIYAGVLVVVMAVWSIFQAWRKKGSPYSLTQRRAVWFWAGALVISMLLAFGRYAPFYQLFFNLPYSSTMRNPAKFMHIFSWILIIIFAYGVHGLVTAYLQGPAMAAGSLMAQFKTWRRAASAFERKWMNGLVWAVGLAVVGGVLYAASAATLKDYLNWDGIAPEQVSGIASFSLWAVAWFVLFLILTVLLLAAIFSGQFRGARIKWAGVWLGLLLVVDLGRADRRWMVYFDTGVKYAPDPVISVAAEKSYEHRLGILPWGVNNQQWSVLGMLYETPWKQGLFWYENLQCLDVAQEPRLGTDKVDFLGALRVDNPQEYPQGTLRHWELTGTRYLLAPGGNSAEVLNSQVDPKEKRFRSATFPDGSPVKFDLVLKQPRLGRESAGFVAAPKDDNHLEITEYTGTPDKNGRLSNGRTTNYVAAAVDFISKPNTNGQLSLLEFTGALPRASLFSNWKVADEAESLRTVTDPGFNPHQVVLVTNAISAPSPTNAGQPAGEVRITSYEPKLIKLEAEAKTPAVLLLCDRYNPHWRVSVDGQPAELLRCNFIERGVLVQPGKHQIEFSYRPPITTLYVSLGAIVVGLILCGLLVLVPGNPPPSTPVASPVPVPPSSPEPVMATAKAEKKPKNRR